MDESVSTFIRDSVRSNLCLRLSKISEFKAMDGQTNHRAVIRVIRDVDAEHAQLKWSVLVKWLSS